MSSSKRTAREVVELYNLSLWNERRLELADELIADTMIRHDVGESHTLTRAEALKRVTDMWNMFDRLHFQLDAVIAGDDGEHVTILYNSSMSNKAVDEIQVASMEVFRVIDGQITEVWNCGYKQGTWA